MLYFNFKNYEEFKVLFGKRVGNNGKNIRSNGILLSFYKHEFKCKRFYSLKNVMSVDHIYREFTNCLGYAEHSLANGMHFAHPDYIIDSFKGVCEDGDSRCIRYTKADGRVYKMKAGKLMRKLLERYDIVGKFCEQAVIYVCERFAEEWRSFVESKYGFKYTLHVNDNFYKIYSYNYCKRDFNSCMMKTTNIPSMRML